MANVTLLHYNNYFNRIVKKEDFYTSYLTSDPNYNKIENVNFVPGDGISTSLVLGTYSLNMGFDYVVVTEIVNGAEVIKSRWFLMEEHRTRDGQYEIVLRRDVIADHYDAVLSSPCFIEKGYINSVSNPLLYNKEGNLFNQIKKGEELLKDRTQSAWIVGYFDKNYSGPSGNKFQTVLPSVEQETTDASSLPFFDALNIGSHVATKTAAYNPNPQIYFQTHPGMWTTHGYFNSWVNSSNKIEYTHTQFPATSPGWRSVSSSLVKITWPVQEPGWTERIEHLWEFSGTISPTVQSNLINKSYDTLGSDNKIIIKLNDYLNYENMLVDYDNKIYRLKFTLSSSKTHDVGFVYDANNETNAFVQALSTYMASDSQYTIDTDSASSSKIGVYTTYQELVIVAEEVPAPGTITLNWPATRNKNMSDVFDLFMIPYSTVPIGVYNSPIPYNNKDAAMAMALEIAKQMGSHLYDLQILPYSPINEPLGKLVYRAYRYFFSDLKEEIDYEWMTMPEEVEEEIVNKRVSFVYFPKSNNFTTFLPKVQSVDAVTGASAALSAKIENECTNYRLCSPNYNGIFEYNLSKFINGNTGFNVYCTYKPFTPYIKMNPVYAGLYGTDYADSTGLICGGDFSLGIINDQWVNYQIQNKNFQSMFDRQIQSMDVNHGIAKQEALWQIGAGTVQSAASGAVAGGMVGGAYGAVAGAAIGGISSLAGGIADYANLNKKLADQRGLTLDMHKYELGNIQALPRTITKSSPLTANNKIWPVLEKISCTDEEKTIFKTQLQYDGESIGAIGTIADYMTSDDFDKVFIKGEIIRMDINEDSHMFDEIFAEVKQGVYL